jgi:hypothetical protein
LALVETNDPASALSIGHYKASVTYEDAATGASTAIALAGFPLGVVVLGCWLEITEAFAGEADVAVTVGDTSDGDYLITSFNLNAVAATKMADTTIGSGALPCTEADWDGDGLDITFAATELGDLTAGALTVHILYHKPE